MSDHKVGRAEYYGSDSITMLSWRGPVFDVRLSIVHAPDQPVVVALSMYRRKRAKR